MMVGLQNCVHLLSGFDPSVKFKITKSLIGDTQTDHEIIDQRTVT